jgi:hypothetical protein
MYVLGRQMYVSGGHGIICQVKILDSITIVYRYTCIHVYSLNINIFHMIIRARPARRGYTVKYIKLLLPGAATRHDRMYLHYYI